MSGDVSVVLCPSDLPQPSTYPFAARGVLVADTLDGYLVLELGEAYGLGDDWRDGKLTKDEILSRLFALDQERAKLESKTNDPLLFESAH